MSLKVRSASEMVADYHRLLPLHGGEKAPAWMHRESKSDQPADVMVSQALALAARWKTIQSQQLTLDMRMARLGACNQQVLDLQVMLGGQEQTTRRVEQQLHEAMHALASRDHEIAAVYASTSWRISSPVRRVGRRLRQGKILARCLFGLLSQPWAMPDRARSIARAWRSEGRAGLKRALLQWLESGNAPVLPELAAPAEPNVVEPEVDWRQQVLRNYRASFSDNAQQAIRARIQAMDSPPTISVLVPAYKLPLAYLHAFPFSRRKGTPPAVFPAQVPSQVIRARCRALRELGEKKREAYYRSFLGQKVKVLVESKRDRESGLLKGFSPHYIPILLPGEDESINQEVEVEVTEVRDGKVFGKTILPQRAQSTPRLNR